MWKEEAEGWRGQGWKEARSRGVGTRGRGMDRDEGT